MPYATQMNTVRIMRSMHSNEFLQTLRHIVIEAGTVGKAVSVFSAAFLKMDETKAQALNAWMQALIQQRPKHPVQKKLERFQSIESSTGIIAYISGFLSQRDWFKFIFCSSTIYIDCTTSIKLSSLRLLSESYHQIPYQYFNGLIKFQFVMSHFDEFNRKPDDNLPNDYWNDTLKDLGVIGVDAKESGHQMLDKLITSRTVHCEKLHTFRLILWFGVDVAFMHYLIWHTPNLRVFHADSIALLGHSRHQSPNIKEIANFDPSKLWTHLRGFWFNFGCRDLVHFLLRHFGDRIEHLRVLGTDIPPGTLGNKLTQLKLEEIPNKATKKMLLSTNKLEAFQLEIGRETKCRSAAIITKMIQRNPNLQHIFIESIQFHSDVAILALANGLKKRGMSNSNPKHPIRIEFQQRQRDSRRLWTPESPNESSSSDSDSSPAPPRMRLHTAYFQAIGTILSALNGQKYSLRFCAAEDVYDDYHELWDESLNILRIAHPKLTIYYSLMKPWDLFISSEDVPLVPKTIKSKEHSDEKTENDDLAETEEFESDEFEDNHGNEEQDDLAETDEFESDENAQNDGKAEQNEVAETEEYDSDDDDECAFPDSWFEFDWKI